MQDEDKDQVADLEQQQCVDEDKRELDYWRRYFGLRRGTDAATKAHNRAQLRAFAPPGFEEES